MFLIVDGTNLAHRACYALKATRTGLMVSASGKPITSVSVVLRSLLTVMKVHNPTHLAVAFDTAQPTFRHELYPKYKANRAKEKDVSLVADIQMLQIVLTDAGFGVAAPSGYEADDVMATLKHLWGDQKALLYSGDRDLFQLVDEQTSVLYPSKQLPTVVTPSRVVEMMKVPASQVVDYKALCGDTSDNIPGIEGVGEKTAINLLKSFPTVEQIYEGISQITGTPYKRLKQPDAKEHAMLSKQLATLVMDVPLTAGIEQFSLSNLHRNFDSMAKWLHNLGLESIAQAYEDYLTDRLF